MIRLIVVGSYSIFNGPNIQKTSGTVYFVKDTTEDQSIARNQSIDENDFVCIDQRSNKDPNIKIINSVKSNDSQIRQVIKILQNYEEKNPSDWDRTDESLYKEWVWHNYINIPAHFTDGVNITSNWVKRTKDVDLNNIDEKTFPSDKILPDFKKYI